MIAPEPWKYVCTQCGFSKIIKPRSDVLDVMHVLSYCPKCKGEMGTQSLTTLEKIFSKINPLI